MNRLRRAKTVSVLLLAAASVPAHATMPVIDVAAITQLIQEILAWDEQLQGMRQQLDQLQQTHAALTGSRGMGQLLQLSPAARNYLPSEWTGLSAVLSGAGVDPAITRAARAQLGNNVVLSVADQSRLPQNLQALLQSEREAVAGAQALTRAAYGHSSDRFASLSTLIDQIRATQDAKAIAELQGRIGAEQAMVANEAVKLAALAQVTDAERAARELVRRETVVSSHGDFATRFQPTPPVP
jgi:type IV secretion system protein VirB5